MKLYHGSMIEHLVVSNSGTGLGYNFGAMFFARTYGTAKGYGDYVYQCEVDVKDIFLRKTFRILKTALLERLYVKLWQSAV